MAISSDQVEFFRTRQQIWGYYRDELRQVEEQIRRIVESQGSLISRLGRYFLDGGGKRIRPLLIIVTSKLTGRTPPERALVTLATAVELIHTTSLLHDDVLDNAEKRRGRDSARVLWGNKASILVGDHLYAQGIRLAQSLQNHDLNDSFIEACCLMTKGEAVQLAYHGNTEITEETYLEVIRHKTASLISASCRMSGILSGVPKGEQDDLAQFGYHLGLAYQIIDDTLDYVGDKRLFGKAICQDLREGKVTLPLLHTLSSCNKREGDWVRAILKEDPLSEENVAKLIQLINQYHSIEYALDRARGAVESAKETLYSYPDSPHRQALLSLADFVLTRSC